MHTISRWKNQKEFFFHFFFFRFSYILFERQSKSNRLRRGGYNSVNCYFLFIIRSNFIFLWLWLHGTWETSIFHALCKWYKLHPKPLRIVYYRRWFFFFLVLLFCFFFLSVGKKNGNIDGANRSDPSESVETEKGTIKQKKNQAHAPNKFIDIFIQL